MAGSETGAGGASLTADLQEVDLTGLPEWLRPGQVARLLRVVPRTLWRWEQRGVLRSTRTQGGHRRYCTADVAKMLQQAGVSGQGVRSYIVEASRR